MITDRENIKRVTIELDHSKIDRNQRRLGLALDSLSLWAEWFNELGDYLPYGDSNYCIGCKRSRMSLHAGDCFYLRAQKLVTEARELTE